MHCNNNQDIAPLLGLFAFYGKLKINIIINGVTMSRKFKIINPETVIIATLLSTVTWTCINVISLKEAYAVQSFEQIENASVNRRVYSLNREIEGVNAKLDNVVCMLTHVDNQGRREKCLFE